VLIDAKMWSPEAGKKSYKKILKITAFDLHISTLCRAGPAGSIFTIFGLTDHIADVIIRVKF